MVKIEILKLNLPYFKVNTSKKNKALQNRIAGENKDLIPGLRIHNKGGTENKYEDYSYPLVQYRSVNGNGELFAINNGIKDLINFYNNNEVSNVLKTEFGITNWNIQSHNLRLNSKSQTYFSDNYIVLDEDNKKIFDSIPSDLEEEFQQKSFLEEKIVSHLIEFCKRFNYCSDGHLWVRVIDFNLKAADTFTKTNKDKTVINYSLTPFQITFQTNLEIPNEIGLGKKKAKGYGIVSLLKN